MKFLGYRSANVTMVGEGFRLKALAVFASLLGLRFHYQGIPFGRF